MTTATFDTLRTSKEFKEAGFSEREAEALAGTLGRLLEDQVVTRQYLDHRRAELRNDLLKWMVLMLLGQAGLVVALMKMV